MAAMNGEIHVQSSCFKLSADSDRCDCKKQPLLKCGRLLLILMRGTKLTQDVSKMTHDSGCPH